MVVALGDSITYGQFVDRDKVWTTLVGAENRGVCGETTRLALLRLPRELEARPDTLIVQYGLNDCNRWETDHGVPRVSGGCFSMNLNEIIDRAQDMGVRRIVLCTLTRSNRNKRVAEDSLFYSALVRMVASIKSVELFDAENYVPEGLWLDGLHLCPEGHRVYAEGIAGVLNEHKSFA